jgi:type I restriction enzyme M protein
MAAASTIVQRVWNYCHILRDDGLSYSDYLEQLTYLLFLKLADESGGERDLPHPIPSNLSWPSLTRRTGEGLQSHYRHILAELGQSSGLIALIFHRAQNKINDPAKLQRLISLIDKESWIGLNFDLKAEIYEGLLEKNAQDIKSGAGQYFTPRPLVQAIVEVMQPTPGQRIADPAAGTGGFLLAAYDYILRQHGPLDPAQLAHLRHEALRGWEIVEQTARLGVMNLYLHGLGVNGRVGPITVGDSLLADPGERFELVLTNPPFGKRGSVTFAVGSDGKPASQTLVRDDFWAATSNKQLNFIQHIKTLLKPGGRAAVIVPDNVLFEGGAGEIVRRKLLHSADVHTLLRLPTGIFYAHGIKANVLFFDAPLPHPHPRPKSLWIYDLRTNQNFTLKQNPLARANLDDFVTCFNPANRHERVPIWSPQNPQGRWRAFSIEELLTRDKANLDICWLRDETREDWADLPQPDLLAAEIVEDLRLALEEFSRLVDD